MGGHFQAHEGGWDPRARVQEMGVDGVSAEVLYPSLTMDLFGLTDPALQEACFRVYNDWIIDYCSVAPERLTGLACISTYDIEHALAELERCRKSGLRGFLVWQAPPESLAFTTDHYERLWAAAQDMGMPVSLHILTGTRYPFPRARTAAGQTAVRAFREAVNTKLLDASNAMADLIGGGVLERFPRLKFVLVENEISWLPFYLTQYDKYWGRGNLQSEMTMSPSAYFERQFYATFFNDTPIRWILGEWGTTNMMWSNDYPHPNSTWPNSRDVIQRDLGHLPADVQTRLVRENVVELYGLKVPATA
ncbi:MAG TPA: amidohydrolase family protein [Chloroflexota bacterium]|nr:amidohydrolase family protein [Chloroflexota bacterium]